MSTAISMSASSSRKTRAQTCTTGTEGICTFHPMKSNLSGKGIQHASSRCDRHGDRGPDCARRTCARHPSRARSAPVHEDSPDVGAITSQILVAGIGNIFLGDDGFGPEVMRHVPQRLASSRVRLVDYGIRGMHLAY